MRLTTIVLISLLCMAFCGCHREPTIEEQPVKDIQVSHPAEFVAPDKDEVQKKKEVLGADKIYKVDSRRYYHAAIPKGAVEISVSQSETRFYVREMNASEVKAFLDKYFPYQNKIYRPEFNRFMVEGKVMEEYADDSIIPQIDLDVIKPTPENAVEITVFWNQTRNDYEWIYKDPLVREREAEAGAEIEKVVELRRQEMKIERKSMPSNDSPGTMVNARNSEIR